MWTFSPAPTTVVPFFFTSFELDEVCFCDPKMDPKNGDKISIIGELSMQYNTNIFKVFFSLIT